MGRVSHENQSRGLSHGVRNCHLSVNAFKLWHQKWITTQTLKARDPFWGSWKSSLYQLPSLGMWNSRQLCQLWPVSPVPFMWSNWKAFSCSFLITGSRIYSVWLYHKYNSQLKNLTGTMQLSQPPEEKSIKLDQVFCNWWEKKAALISTNSRHPHHHAGSWALLPTLQRCPAVCRSSLKDIINVGTALGAFSFHHLEKFMWLRKIHLFLEVIRAHLHASPQLSALGFYLVSFSKNLSP